MIDQAVPAPKHVFGIFCGPIDQASAQKLANVIGLASNQGVAHLHLLFQSTGGYVGDGVFLYNLFRAVPFELTLYNAGHIASAGVVAFLGAKRRKTTTNAAFVLHRSGNSPQFANADRLQQVAKSLALDDERTESILRDAVRMPQQLWDDWRLHCRAIRSGR